MPKDRSLDEFLDDDEEPDDAAPGEAERPGSTASGDPEGEDEHRVAVEPLPSTYAWSPDGGVCAECDAVVDARWYDDGALVCEDCKNW